MTDPLPNVLELRSLARKVSLQAIRGMIAAVQGALDGEPLRGLPNLASSSHPYAAARVRSKAIDEPLSRQKDKADLCINRRAQLVFAWRTEDGVTLEKPARDDDLFAEDAEHVAETLVAVLERHRLASGRAARRYDDILKIAKRINRALDGEE